MSDNLLKISVLVYNNIYHKRDTLIDQTIEVMQDNNQIEKHFEYLK